MSKMENLEVPGELSCARCEGRVIEIAAANDDVASMIRLALHGRSKGAKARAAGWLREVHNVGVIRA
ncbi:MAG: hypothetical protein JNM03_11860 [Sphingopyxis sp.]|uniref:hypothetical protein n=1 Tax=Sphingopyxis sp. TaxID=1908224 RepID=UPI001A388EFF|nr:hypothetical protein [Sphingopyxis sp.]MBL9070668.1 hypothetical protein [Sphingopyxis sp.]